MSACVLVLAPNDEHLGAHRVHARRALYGDGSGTARGNVAHHALRLRPGHDDELFDGDELFSCVCAAPVSHLCGSRPSERLYRLLVKIRQYRQHQTDL